MEKRVRLLDYKDRKKTFIIKDYEKVVFLYFQIISGDGVLDVVYPDKIIRFDSSDKRCMAFDDGSWFLLPKHIGVINLMKDHYDTEKLDKVSIPWGE